MSHKTFVADFSQTTLQTLKFPDDSQHSVHVNWYSYHASNNWMLLNTCTDANMQLTINSFCHFSLTRFFPDTSLTFSKIADISQTAVEILDISRFFQTSNNPETLVAFLGVTAGVTINCATKVSMPISQDF